MDLNESEKKLIEACKNNQHLAINAKPSSEDYPDELIIRSEVIRAIVYGKMFELTEPANIALVRGKVVGVLYIDGKSNLGCLHFEECYFDSDIILRGSDFDNLAFTKCHCNSIKAELIKTKRNFVLNGSKIIKGIALRLATIGAQLDADNTTIDFEGGCNKAISAGEIRVGASVFLRNSNINGEVFFRGARIGGSFEADGSNINTNGDLALDIQSSRIGDAVFIRRDQKSGRPFLANGQVSLLDAIVEGYVDCNGAELTTVNYYNQSNGGNIFNLSLNCSRLETRGSLLLGDGFKSQGIIELSGARIGSNLECFGASFVNTYGPCFRAISMTITDVFIWIKMVDKPVGQVNLSGSTATRIIDDSQSWPSEGNLIIEGLSYKSFGERSPVSVSQRLKWLRLQPKGKIIPRTYIQVAEALKNMGLVMESREILYFKNEDLRINGNLSGWPWCLNKLLSITIGHGYKPLYSFGWIACLILIGGLIYLLAYSNNLIITSKSDVYSIPAFLIFASSEFLPFIDFSDSFEWIIDMQNPWSVYLYIFKIFYQIIGILITALAGIGLSGLLEEK